MNSLLDKSISELLSGYESQKWTISDVINECYQNIEKYNPNLNALISITDKSDALKEALKLQEEIDRKEIKSPLHGIPYIMKDSYISKGIKTTAGAKILENYIPPNEGSVHATLKNAGAILLGKGNMDAWGHGASNENSDFGPVKNPYDETRVAGGSGGGPAAAVATRMAGFGIGEDTGGSIRNPAAWCGISAMKVTYGRVSRYGCVAYASSFDTVGPTAKSAQDCATILKVIAGKDAYDATTAQESVPDYVSKLNQQIKNIRLGFPKSLFNEKLDSEIEKSIIEAVEVLKKSGVQIVDVDIPTLTYGISIYYVIAPSETSSNLARYDGVRYGLNRTYFGAEAKRRIMIGTHALSSGYYDAYYKKALKARTLLIKSYELAFRKCDALIMPVTPYHPTKLGSFINDPVQNMLTDIYTVTQNIAGLPSFAFPIGFSKENLPIGMQLTGPRFSEDMLFALGHSFQQQTDWHKRSPNL